MSTARHLPFPKQLRVPPEDVVFGSSPAMQRLKAQLSTIAETDVPVLIQGESGTGKEIIARLLHMRSPWRTGPFVKVNCPAIPGTLIESELFGYERGAFTGAYGNKPGRVEMADRGTLFLDEIGELEMSLQSKLLQLLQEGCFCRIGAQQDRSVDVRVVCATNRRLEQQVAAGSFREDLFYRVNVVTIELPPLRLRANDIPKLASYFLSVFSQQYDRKVPALSSQMMHQLQQYDWPGNIRQLENVLRRYVILGSENDIRAALVSTRNERPKTTLPSSGRASYKTLIKNAMRDVERDILLQALEANNWNRRKVAENLGLSYRALLYKTDAAGLRTKRQSGRPIKE